MRNSKLKMNSSARESISTPKSMVKKETLESSNKKNLTSSKGRLCEEGAGGIVGT